MQRAVLAGQLGLVVLFLAAARAGRHEGGRGVAVVRDGGGGGDDDRGRGRQQAAGAAAAAAVIAVEGHGLLVLHIVLLGVGLVVAACHAVGRSRRSVDGDDVGLGLQLAGLAGLQADPHGSNALAHQLVGPPVVVVLGHGGAGRSKWAGRAGGGADSGEVGGGRGHLLAAPGDGVAAGVVALAPDQVGQDPTAGVDEPVADLVGEKDILGRSSVQAETVLNHL